MIPKGNQRGGGQQLATHLLNAYDNEKVELGEITGSIAPDLHGSFAEWKAHASGTKCRKYLYSLSVNPDHSQGQASRDQYLDFINRVENNLGLTNQPRAIIFHTKNGREHCHVVWSRIDTGRLRAVQLSHDRQKLRTTAQEYARDRGITLPEGMRKDRGVARFEDRKKRENLQEKQQQERTGVSKADRRKTINNAWTRSDSPKAFVKALENAGFYLCRGDKRGYVVVDLYGEVHSLARQIDGVNTKQLIAKLSADFPIDKLPPAEKAQTFARQKRNEHLRGKFNAAQIPTLAERRNNLQRIQAKRRANLNAERDEMVFRHHNERAALRQLQKADNQGVLQARLQKQKTGLTLFLQRITGIGLIKAYWQKREDIKRSDIHRQQVAALNGKHDRERQELERQATALKSLEARERQSLNTALRREEFRTLARGEPDKEKQTDTGRQHETLSDAFRERAEQNQLQKDRQKDDRGRSRDRDRDR